MLVTCYLCGKNYGRYVFPGHHNKCRNVWEEKEKKKPRSERSPVPAGPPHLVQVLAGSAGEEGLELYNQRALAVWNKEVLEECRHCARYNIETVICQSSLAYVLDTLGRHHYHYTKKFGKIPN